MTRELIIVLLVAIIASECAVTILSDEIISELTGKRSISLFSKVSSTGLGTNFSKFFAFISDSSSYSSL